MVAMDGLQTLHDERARFDNPYDDRYSSTWEGASLKPFRTKDEYLYAMREDLAEWLSNLYDLEILPESFFDRLENGALLCQHANKVRREAIDYRLRNFPDTDDVEFVHGILVKQDDLRYKRDAKAGTFLARDNISNFIHWCRHSLRINEVLLFESDDLVLRKNDKSFILCLLEVARRGGPIGMPVPMLVQLEQEIDRELEAGTPSEPDSFTSTEPASPSSETTTDAEPESEADSEGRPMECASSPEPSPQRRGSLIPKVKPRSRRMSSKHHNQQEPQEDGGDPPKQIMLNAEVLKTLDELVRAEVERCSCPMQFPMIRIAEGKYRIGDSNTLIFVRILRKHVMVRVGGGWDTLTHYLDKHDPCRCIAHKKNQRRSTAGADFGPRSPKRKSSVKPSDVYHALNGQSSDGTTSPTESETTRSNSPTNSPNHRVKPDVRPRSAVMSPPRRQSNGDTYRPNSLNLSVRNSPRPLRRGNSFDSSPRFVTSPDSSDTYSNSDLGGNVTPTKDSTLKRNHRSNPRKMTPDSDSTACSEPVPMSVGSPVRRRNSTKQTTSNSNRTSQTATEEFMRRKRQQARAQSVQGADCKLERESCIQSAPTSPTRRRGNPLSSSMRSASRPRDLVRRAAVGAADERRMESGGGRESRGKAVKTTGDSKLPVREYSMSPSLSRRSSTPGGLTRKSRPQSAKTSRELDKTRLYSSEEPVMMIKRDDDGRHRVDSTSSCESNGSSVKSGSRSLSGIPSRRLSESNTNKNRYRSISVDRSNSNSDQFGAASERRRSLFERTHSDRTRSDRTHSDRRKSLDRSNSGCKKLSVERPSLQVHRVRSENVQPRSRSLSRDWQTNSLRHPKTSSNRSQHPLSRSSSARGSPVRRRRSDIPLTPNHLRPDSWDNGATAGVPPTSTRSRLRPPTAIPSHLKPDHSSMTSVRSDTRRDSRPTRIPLPSGHKRLLEAQTRSRSNSLPTILADLLEAYQTVQNSTRQLQNMDPFDLSPCRSSEGDSISPTSSVRTAPDLNHDSGYEDNAILKFSPNLNNHHPVLPSIDSTKNGLD